ncbi:protein-glutamate O-methyltransferase CheR [Anaerobacillus sp. CMMVII]|uniref:CheR family methyltransferase n=1 Tax=Anaerobacillus sp. CMMVII TaxID=2755588 RepID=UPI0021B838A3|nr:protein-glutamate O-methyltransferase CheR [Anaerobacillus sp. CMMVII]MCT8138893.1 protein-glutamate O-methyltransferase CheR [Anaerobacillus sp. CMMVII]
MDDYQGFILNVKSKTGIDLSLYKEAQMKRRLSSLRDKRGFNDFLSYFQAMIRSQELFDEFLERMTINVSEFYRNPIRWEVLERKVLPRLLQSNRRLRVWSAACSTGEEPYTLAMILNKQGVADNTTIIATDIDRSILDRARAGIYTDRSMKDVPKEMLAKYFLNDGMGFRVKDEIKNMITFKQGNLLADKFEQNFDLIICRNVMIYFTEEAKDELYHKFSRALRPGGTLFVGSTEQIFNPGEYGFENEDTFFYRKPFS